MSENLEKEVLFLREEVSKLTTILEQERLLSQEKIALIQFEYDRVIEAYKQAQRARFGRKAERFVDDPPDQIGLFDTSKRSEKNEATESDDSSPIAPPTDPEDIETITYIRKKSKANVNSEIPTREVIIAVPEAERRCGCGQQKEVIRYETSQRLNYQPAVFEMIIEKREICACRKGCEGSVVTAKKPTQILPKCKATESLLSYIAVSKVLDRQPLYHLEKSIQQRYHWHIPRQTMARWLIQLAEPLMPLINLMKDQLIAYDIAAVDATTLHVLKEPGRAPETKSFAYCLRGGPPGKEVILYEYNAYSQKDYVTETFLDFKGVIHCDASPVFNGIASQEGIELSYCHAHTRRKFEQIVTANKKAKHPLAKEALTVYHALYQIEKQAKEKNMTFENRHQLRQDQSRPILDNFHHWLTTNKEKTLPKSPIGQAIAYTLNHWDGLQRFLRDGRLEIDNNATERDIKPFVIARKNFLFACTQAGADALGVHFSLILTARLHGLNPLLYYQQILERIPACGADYGLLEQLLPWNFKEC